MKKTTLYELKNQIDETIEDVVQEVCDNYCKYGEQYKEDEKEESQTGINKTYEKHCKNCPLITRL